MTNFYSTDAGFSTMSAAELHACAVRGGRLGSFGFGYAKPEVDSTVVRHGFRAMIVDSKGMGNHGDIVLVPVSSEARASWRAGKTEWLKGFGLSVDQAGAYLDARVQYALEGPVAAAAASLARQALENSMPASELANAAQATSHREMGKRLAGAFWRWSVEPMDLSSFDDLSIWRKQSALALAAALVAAA